MEKKMSRRSKVANGDFLASQVETWPLEELTASPRNARRHSDEQVGQLVESIRRFGFTFPVLVSEGGEIIAGHGRVDAARALQLDAVPVIVARGWSEDQCRAYALADNRLAEQATWDQEMLASEVKALLTAGVDMAGVGFSATELDAYLPKNDGAFLSGLGTEERDEDPPDAHVDGRGVSLNLHYAPEERDRVARYLKRERDSRGLKTIAEALLALADEGTQ
jgi:ParB-like chromosome segregation protein Spo0J